MPEVFGHGAGEILFPIQYSGNPTAVWTGKPTGLA